MTLRLPGLITLIIMLPGICHAQLFEFRKNGLWGLMDGAGRVVVNPTYDYIHAHPERLYFFTRKGRKTGLYHRDEGEIIAPVYDFVYLPENEQEDVIRIADEGRFGLLDSLGREIFAPEYNEITFLRPGCYAVRKGNNRGLRSIDEKLNIPLRFRLILPFDTREHQFFIATTGDGYSSVWRRDGLLTAERIPHEIEAVAGEMFVYREGNMYGLLDAGGNQLTSTEFTEVQPAGPHVRVVKDRKSGLFSATGQEILPPVYQKINADSTGHCWFLLNNHWGIVGLEGNILAEPQFTHQGSFIGPVAKVQKDTLGGVINQFGDFLAEVKYRTIRLYPGMIRTTSDGEEWSQTLFDEEGRPSRMRKMVIAENSRNFEYNAFRSRQIKSEPGDLGWFEKDGLWGLRDTTIGRILLPGKFASVKVWPQHNLSVVQSGSAAKINLDRFGLVSHPEGRLITQTSFIAIFPDDLQESEAMRAIFPNQLFAIINKQGKILYIKNATYISAPYKGVFRVKINGRKISPERVDSPELEQEYANLRSSWYLYDDTGNPVSPDVFSYLGPFHADISPIRKNKGRKSFWGLTNTRLDSVLAPVWNTMQDPGGEGNFLIAGRDTSILSFLDAEGNFVLSRDEFYYDADSQQMSIRELGNFYEGMLRTKIDNQWGFLNTKGEVAVPPVFRETGNFSEGLAPVRSRKGWGYIDSTGQWIIKPRYREAKEFSEQLALVRNNRGWGYINHRGKYVLRPKMQSAESFHNGLAAVRHRYWGVMDQQGKWMLKPDYSSIQLQGKDILYRRDGRFGYLNQNGEVWIPEKYTYLGPVQEGRIAYLEKLRYGFLDESGEEIIPASYREVKDFSEGLAAVNTGGRWGYIDRAGNTVIRPSYEAAVSFLKSAAAVKLINDSWGVIDTMGNTIIPFEYTEIVRSPEGWIGCVKKDSVTKKMLWTYFDQHGVRVSHEVYENGSPFRLGLATVLKGDRQHIINIRGIPLTLAGYDYIFDYGDDMIVTRNDHLYGLIDRDGHEVIPPDYEAIEFIDGLYRLHLHGKMGYVDQFGEWVLPLSK